MDNRNELLDKYILDYMKKKGFHTAAALFSQEAKINQELVASGNLSDWWKLSEKEREEYISQEVESPKIVPEMPEPTSVANLCSSSHDKQMGSKKIPIRDSGENDTKSQLRLSPKSNKGGNVAKVDMPMEKDDEIS